MKVTVTAKFPVSLDLDVEGEPGTDLDEDRVGAALDHLAEQATMTGYLAEWMVTQGGGWTIKGDSSG